MPTVPPTLIERVRYLLCDADGNLFPSEEPAFDASAEVTNAFLASVGIERRYTPDELRAVATGMNFRSTGLKLAADAGVTDAGKAIALGVGAGLGSIGAGIGIGIIFGKEIESVARQPEMRDEITGIQWLGFALTEACFFYGLVAGLIAFFL